MSGSGDNPVDGIVVFRLGERDFALPAADVREVVPFAWLSRPLQMPSAVEGVLNLGGDAVPVLRLDRLLALPDGGAGLDSSILIMRGRPLLGLLVDRVDFVRRGCEVTVAPLEEERSFNGCVTASVAFGGDALPLLSWPRLLVAEERMRLGEFQARAQARIDDVTEPAP